VNQNGTYCFNTNDSNYDTAIYVRQGNCNDFDGELLCDDQGDEGDSSELELDLFQGEEYFLFVDGYSNFNSGDFTLRSFQGACP